jgi:hypothetical protein
MAVEFGDTNESTEDLKRSDSGTMRDLFRKTVSNTVRSMGGDERIRQVVQSLMKEEAVQAIVNSKLAKDAIGYAARTLDALKEEVVSMAGRQMNDFLQRVDVGNEIQKILTTLSLEIRAEVRFIPNEKRVVKPEVKSTVSVRKVEKETDQEAKKSRKKTKPLKRASDTRTRAKTTRTSTKSSTKPKSKMTTTGRASKAKSTP